MSETAIALAMYLCLYVGLWRFERYLLSHDEKQQQRELIQRLLYHNERVANDDR